MLLQEAMGAPSFSDGRGTDHAAQVRFEDDRTLAAPRGQVVAALGDLLKVQSRLVEAATAFQVPDVIVDGLDTANAQ